MLFFIVDSDATSRNLLKELLTEQLVQFTTMPKFLEARDGVDALRSFQVEGDHIDVICAELDMERMSGLELLCKVRAVSKSIPFIMMSARPDRVRVVEARRAGVTAFLVKPFSAGQVREKFMDALTIGGG